MDLLAPMLARLGWSAIEYHQRRDEESRRHDRSIPRTSAAVTIGDNLTVGSIGYGAMQLTGPKVWGEYPDHAKAIALLRAVVEQGVTYIDTADVYGPHSNEELIREAQPLDRLLIASEASAKKETSTMTEAAPQPVDLTVVDTNSAEWIKFPVPEIGAELDCLPLIDDSDTGMQVMKMIYRAGFTNPWHTHDCAHGIYVLEGTLNSHQGTHPAGSFVWFPQGGTMLHGATDDADCHFLFITNKPFTIHYGD